MTQDRINIAQQLDKLCLIYKGPNTRNGIFIFNEEGVYIVWEKEIQLEIIVLGEMYHQP